MLIHSPIHPPPQGILSVVGEERRVMLQAVQELYEAEPVDPWTPECPRTCKFVFIGECWGKEDKLQRCVCVCV